MILSALIGAWLAGVLGGVHCLAMCGGFVAAIAARDRADGSAPLLPARAIVRRQLAYHAGRIAMYAALGAAFAEAGAAMLQAANLLPLQRALYVIANAFLLLLALRLVSRSNSNGAGWLQRAGGTVFAAALPMLRPLLARPGVAGRVSLGLVWGLVPCALVYSVLPLAFFSGGAWQGAAVMLAFGLGTLPNLAAAGVLMTRAKPWFRHGGVRFAAAGLLTVFAMAGIYRALYVPDALAQGPFCLVP